ncbi:MAG TPA: hypothetical protein PLE45_02185 [Spirochaetota bacterium]|nr:hypothetical protein [Spirochaetota bacterium]HPP04418.1 hypothetical protein [Spirochaetota bacterium]
MLTEKIDSNIIHFFQKVLDKTTLIRFTTEFTLRIFALFYKKQHDGFLGKESNKIIQSIQGNLFARINDYVKDINITPNNIIEIKFEKDNAIPSVSLHHDDKISDILINVFFKKISWDEINEFRVFLIRYLNYYLYKFHSDFFTNEEAIKKNVSNVAYVVQEMLQNANAYSYGPYDYELILRYSNNKFYITVSNFAKENNYILLKQILDEIRNATDLKTLLLKYMLSEEKHLGLITCIFNYDITDYNLKYIDNKIVEINLTINAVK